ncbi:right-handed parallel beta-helix repeat-containing protein [Streptomyces sp. JJ38]|uniref:right-handed parallel beta-helix repeat-containing protein n=1 Tax=Streptomyces sp. JJ38 TaxID=2738128 RepID=UPI001C576062|nr:right-handed parallel beta-helix repeat-containing protein [Streptomyces sp. JJ38]MBW1597808.1 right-handed parallel beta-helix repeat-containing protein [Streptomyces sp. JJ38]
MAGGLLAVVLLPAGCALPEPYAPPGKNAAGGFTYYVSPDGDDGADGTSPETAWRTLDRADVAKFRPGDRLRLQGGAKFRGGLDIAAGEAGDAENPVVVESFGKGRAVIRAASSAGVAVHNTGGVVIRDLVLRGGSGTRREYDGVQLFSDVADGERFGHVWISDVDASGFRHGIGIGAEDGVGFRDVRVSRATLHDNLEAGLSASGPEFHAETPVYAHEDVRVSDVRAFGNEGDPTASDRNTGSGIVFGSVRAGRIEDSVAFDNGERSSASAVEGPEGIWTYDSTKIVIENNVSYGNHTGSRVDGGGFGLDNNVSESVVQYNLSFGNDGPGYLVYSGKPTGAHRDNVLRFNLSANDTRKLEVYGGIVVYGVKLRDLDVYHNTVAMKANGPVKAPALRLQEDLEGIRVHNNVFLTDGAPVVDADGDFDPDEVALQGNAYHSTGGWTVHWGQKRYDALDVWRAGTGHERWDGEDTGTDEDPCLGAAAAPVTEVAEAALLRSGCPADLEDAGVDLREAGVRDPGRVDYSGTPLRSPLTVGALQGRPEDAED